MNGYSDTCDCEECITSDERKAYQRGLSANPDMAELNKLRRQQELWQRVCAFEYQRQRRFYDCWYIGESSDFGKYLKWIKIITEDK